MMSRYGINCYQNLYQDKYGEVHNEYHFYTETGFYLGYRRFPFDGQYAFDAKILEADMKLLAIRYGLIKSKGHN